MIQDILEENCMQASKEKHEEHKMNDKDRKQKEKHQKRLEQQNIRHETMNIENTKDLKSENKESKIRIMY